MANNLPQVRAAIGLDVGTTAVKALAVDETGTVIARAEAGYPLSTPRPGWAEQDPEDWWRATEQALAALAMRDVAGIGLSGQMHGLVALDASDRVIRPAILWNDGRTGEECAEIEARIGLAELIALTGNRAQTGFTAPKLLWLRKHEPDAYARIARIALPKDYVRLRLCGEHAIDAADASGTLLLDVARRRWSDELLEALELDRSWLPPLLESPERAGETSAGVPVAAGAGDQAAGALGVGVDRPGPLSVALGTSGVVFAALPRFAADEGARVHAFCHAVPGGWHAMGVMLSAGGSLRWLRDVAAPGAGFGELIGEAERWEPGAEGLTFLPYLAGERTPHADPDARGSFTGLALRHDRGALVRAVLEGVAYGLRDSLDLLRELGVEPKRARVSGGGARSELWLRIVASVLELPLERPVVEEGAAYGAALLGGVAGGVWADVEEAVAACVRVRGGVEPEPAWVGPYADGRERFRALYPALRDGG
jgi:xylulokinase